MTLFDQLSNNKGTVSSALGKTLAKQVLDGQTSILMECIDLSSYEAQQANKKHIRSGAAKVVELVAEKQPELVAPYLVTLLPAFSVPEPQTRWMIIRTMGYCAHLNKGAAQKAIPYAEKYIQEKEGLCIASSADLFLGDYGAISEEAADQIFPVLEESMESVLFNEQDWLLEAFIKLYGNLKKNEQGKVIQFAQHWQYTPRKSTQQRARKILKMVK
jgi:hypothetical protein